VNKSTDVLALADELEADEFPWTGTTTYDLEDELAARLRAMAEKWGQEEPGLRDALDAAHTVLSDIYKREGKSFHGSRVKADIESIMPLIDAALYGVPEGRGICRRMRTISSTTATRAMTRR